MSRNRNHWKSGGVIDCFDDVDVCVVTVCLPCLVFSENRSTLHGGAGNVTDEGIDPCLIYCLIMSLSACTLQCLYAYSTRTDIRRKYNLEEEPCDDCMTHICCHFCALCQEHRELSLYPLTTWPLPAAQQASTSYQAQYQQQQQQPRIPRSHQPPVRYLAAGPQSPHHRYQASSSASASGSNVPFAYADYAPPYTGGSSPYVVQGGYYPMGHFHAGPPRPGAPQPLVYEPHQHQMPGPYSGGVLPGIPAHVFHVPKFPDMRRGSFDASNQSDDHNSHRRQ